MGELHVLEPAEEAKIITWTVRYRNLNLWGRWHTLRNIIADGYIIGTAIRYFVLENNEQIELPAYSYTFRFSPERQEALKQLPKESKDSTEEA